MMHSGSWDIGIPPHSLSHRWNRGLICITNPTSCNKRRGMVPAGIMAIHGRERIGAWDFTMSREGIPMIIKTRPIWDISTWCWRRWMNWPKICYIWARMTCGWHRCMFSKDSMMDKISRIYGRTNCYYRTLLKIIGNLQVWNLTCTWRKLSFTANTSKRLKMSICSNIIKL